MVYAALAVPLSRNIEQPADIQNEPDRAVAQNGGPGDAFFDLRKVLLHALDHYLLLSENLVDHHGDAFALRFQNQQNRLVGSDSSGSNRKTS